MQRDNIDTTALSDSEAEDVVDVQSESEQVADEESVSLSEFDEHVVTFNSNVIYIGSFVIIEIGIVIGILLGFVFKGITKK